MVTPIMDEEFFDNFDFGTAEPESTEPPKSIVKRSDQNAKRKKVTFVDPLVTKQVDFDKEPGQTGNINGTEDMSKRAERSVNNLRYKYLRKQIILRTYHTLKLNPLGAVNNPYYRDITETWEQLERSVGRLRKEALKELAHAPQLFSEIHPFPPHLLMYFNAIGTVKGQKRPTIKPRAPKKKKHTKSRIEPMFVPDVFMPLELERQLWQFRRKQLRAWYRKQQAAKGQVEIDFGAMAEHLQQMKAHTMMVEKPFDVFPYDVFAGYNDMETHYEELNSPYKIMTLVKQDRT